MNFIDFINEYVEDDAFKKTINSLYDVWVKNEARSVRIRCYRTAADNGFYRKHARAECSRRSSTTGPAKGRAENDSR